MFFLQKETKKKMSEMDCFKKFDDYDVEWARSVSQKKFEDFCNACVIYYVCCLKESVLSGCQDVSLFCRCNKGVYPSDRFRERGHKTGEKCDVLRFTKAALEKRGYTVEYGSHLECGTLYVTW